MLVGCFSAESHKILYVIQALTLFLQLGTAAGTVGESKSSFKNLDLKSRILISGVLLPKGV